MRTSVIGGLRILSVQLGSIIQAGDCIAVSPRSKVLAVQRQVSEYPGDEGSFEQFRIFRQNIPEPLPDEHFSFTAHHDCPDIRVGFLDIIGVSAAAALQIGSCSTIDTENRTKHTRQLLEAEHPV